MQKILLKQGAISSIVTMLLLLASLLLINFQLHILGTEIYGLTVLILSVFGFATFLNLGFGASLVSYYTKQQDRSEFWTLYKSLCLSFTGISLLLGICIAPLFSIMLTWMNLEGKGLDLFLFIGAMLIGFNRLLYTVISSYWVAKIDFLKVRCFEFLNFNLPLILNLAFYAYVEDINQSIFYAGITNTVFISILFFAALSDESNQKSCFFSLSLFKSFLRESSNFQLISIVTILFRPVLNIAINHNLGLTYNAYFDIALKFLFSGRQIIISAAEPLFSIGSQLNNRNKKRLSYLLVKKYTFYNGLLALAYGIGAIVVGPFILKLWLGSEMAANVVDIVQIIAIGLSANIAVSTIYYYFLALPEGRRTIITYLSISLLIVAILIIFNTNNSHIFSAFVSLGYLISAAYIYMKYKLIK